MKITSSTNPRIKNVVKLRRRRARDDQGLTVIEGLREIDCAHEAGVAFQEIFVCPDLLKQDKTPLWVQSPEDGVKVYEVTRAVYGKIAFGDRREGILAVCSPLAGRLADLRLTGNPFLVIVEAVEKPGNLGTILRSSDAAGVTAVIVNDPATDVFNPGVIRASLGAVFTVPVVQATKEETAGLLKEKGVGIYAAAVDAVMPYAEADFRKACAVILGSEEEGLSPFWLKAADQKIRLPMKGRVDSLNVSATAAVLVYEALRQRSGGQQEKCP